MIVQRTRGLTPTARQERARQVRRGSVLLVVIGLLLLLMLIGFAFFTMASQEHSSSEYYADASKGYSVSIPFDFALEQLIIGPRDNNPQSALYPGKHSLVPNMLGLFVANPVNSSYPTVPSDRHPYNGGFGIHIISGGPAGQPIIDQNFDGVADTGNAWLLTLNFSGAAQQSPMGTPAFAGSRTAIFTNFPALDVGYTYPDINNAFLAYVASEPTGNLVVTPSFHRPMLLRDVNGPYVNWQNDASGTSTDTTTRVMRPHPSHVCTADGVTPRFLAAFKDVFGSNPHRIQYFGYVAGPSSRAFGVDLNNNGTFGEQGVWGNSSNNQAVEYDVDNDNDGVREGVWLDLGYPPITLPDGRKAVPLFSFTVIEADGLINLNTAGNLSWLPQANGLFRPFYGAGQGLAATPDPISHSNMGMSSPSEINPFWALVADPRNTLFLAATDQAVGVTAAAGGPNSALAQYRGFFGLSNMNPASYDMSWIETANMDLLRMFWGCPKYTVTGGGNVQEAFTIDDIIVGRWGDADALLYGQQFGVAGVSPPPLVAPSGATLFPRPGIPLFDDDGDFFAGLCDAGYMFNGAATGGDPTNYQLPLINGGLLTPFVGSIHANASTLFPTMIGAFTNTPFNSPVTLLPFGQPLDFTGAGVSTTTVGAAGHGQQAYLFRPNAALPGQYLFYNQYQGAIMSAGAFASPIVPYQMAFAATTFLPPYLYTGATPVPPGNQGLLTNYDTSTNGAFNSTNGVVDEADETVSLGAYAQTTDQIFPVAETAALQFYGTTDYAAAGGQSRLRQLLSWNFELNLQAAAIRQRFTTASSDRKNHGFAADVTTASLANGDRAWEYGRGNWDGSTPTTLAQFPPMVVPANLTNPTGMNQLVPAVVNNNISAGQVLAEPFRMELAALIGAKLNNSPAPPSSQNVAFQTAPYEFRNTAQFATPWHQQLRYNINRFLTVADPNNTFGSSGALTMQNPVRFRELTPHPELAAWGGSSVSIGTTLGATGSPATSPNLQFPSASNGSLAPHTFVGNPALQEYWARRDRQQMARDLYVMLYMFGGGQDTKNNPVDYATTPNKPPVAGPISYTNSRVVYQDWQLAEMAQFAVNVVDSLDRDDTITMFEYDKDLSDGWNLDDDPMGPPETVFPSGLNDRGVVYGVEAQQLAFNEVLVIVAQQVTNKGVPVNHPATPYDDSLNDHTFTFLEFYNVSPYPVAVSDGHWQVVVLDPGTLYPNLPLVPQQPATVPAAGPGIALTALTLYDVNAYAASGSTPGFIPPASPYTIGSRTDIGNDNVNNPPFLPSTFVVDPLWTLASGNPDVNFANKAATQIVPQYVGPTSILNLDLLTVPNPNTTNSFMLTDSQYNTITASNNGTRPPGAFFDMSVGTGNVATGPFSLSTPAFVSTFVLRRRLNLNRPATPIGTPSYNGTDELDNPFIEVDRMTYANYNPAINDTGKGAVAPFPGAGGGEPVDNNAGPGGPGPAAGAFFNLRDVNDTSLITSANAPSWDIQPKLTRLVSKQRRQPLDGYEAMGGSSAIFPTYPTVWPNWPYIGSAPGQFLPSAAIVNPFTATYPTARTAYYQNQNVLVANGDLTPSQNVPFTYTSSIVFSPNTIGQTSQYMPAGFNTYNGVANNGSNSGGANPNIVFTLWQPHFDRDFASIGELLSVPLYGPSTVTQSLAPKDTGATSYAGLNSLVSEAPLPPTPGFFYQPLVAQAKFFRPQYPINAAQPPALQNTQFDNRWYRVLELLEVPSRANMQIENQLLSQYPWLFPQALQRTQGKLNLNGIRHGEVFHGLLDDPGTFNLNPVPPPYPGYLPYNPANGTYVDSFSYYDVLEGNTSTAGNYRNWWFQFLNARDGFDPATSLYLPGSPASRPFRPMSHYDNSPNGNPTPFPANSNNSLDDTLLRTLPMDMVGGLETRGLFEARTKSDLVTAAQANPNSVDYYTRQRLLSKIAGNTTQRSNVFLAWITVGFFEGYQPNPNRADVIQIGAEMTDQPRRRGFFVIDRSLLEEAWVPDNTNPQNGYFDYSKFILYRKTLQ